MNMIRILMLMTILMMIVIMSMTMLVLMIMILFDIDVNDDNNRTFVTMMITIRTTITIVTAAELTKLSNLLTHVSDTCGTSLAWPGWLHLSFAQIPLQARIRRKLNNLLED